MEREDDANWCVNNAPQTYTDRASFDCISALRPVVCMRNPPPPCLIPVPVKKWRHVPVGRLNVRRQPSKSIHPGVMPTTPPPPLGTRNTLLMARCAGGAMDG